MYQNRKPGLIFTFIFALKILKVSSTEISYHLGELHVDEDQITLSGLSSGGTFAQQLQISYSSLFSGIGVFNHAFYRCGPGDGLEDSYDNACTVVGTLMNASTPYDPELAIADIRNYSSQGLIEDPANLRDKSLYVYAGTKNIFFRLATSMGILDVYEPFIQNASAIRTRIQTANLVLPSDNYGGNCSEPASDNFFIANCGFSGAYESLDFILGGGLIKPESDYAVDSQDLLEFDQTEFFYGIEGDGRHDMDDIGYIYVPQRCHDMKCLLHFYFHGCLTGREYNGTSHVLNSGYLEVAEMNDIIMVFPQVITKAPNSIGCWDTYGFTGKLYATQKGAQVTVVKNMLDRILGRDKELELPNTKHNSINRNY